MIAKNISLLFASCGLALLLTSCSSQSDQQIGTIPDYSSSESQSTATNDKDGDENVVGPQFAHPTMNTLRGITKQRFPAKYPLVRYPHSQVFLVRTYPDLKWPERNQVMLKSEEPTAEIADFYKGDLSKQGWQLVSKYENPRYSSTKWRKGDQEAEIRVSPDPQSRNNIQLFIGPSHPTATAPPKS
jgi:hypothetical protein